MIVEAWYAEFVAKAADYPDLFISIQPVPIIHTRNWSPVKVYGDDSGFGSRGYEPQRLWFLGTPSLKKPLAAVHTLRLVVIAYPSAN